MDSVRISLDSSALAVTNTSANTTFIDVVGSKADDASSAATASQIAMLKQIVEAINNGTGTAIDTNKSIVDLLGTNGTTVTDNAVSVLGAIGANNANNAFDSTAVVANANGSVLELLKYIIDNLSSDTDVAALIGALDTAAATGAVTDTDVVMAYIKQLVTQLLATDSKVGTPLNSGGTATLGAILGDFANTTLVSKFAVPTQDLATDATIAQVVGKKSDTVAGTSLVALAKQALVKLTAGIPQTVSVATLDGSATAWTQAAHRLFTVTGLVKCKVIGLVTESLTGGATLAVGIAGDTGCFIEALADAGAECLSGDMIHNYTTGISTPLSLPEQGYKYISNIDIDLLIGTADVTNGQITFYCEWVPISTGATVVAAAWD
jgi:hypothetical protein